MAIKWCLVQVMAIKLCLVQVMGIKLCLVQVIQTILTQWHWKGEDKKLVELKGNMEKKEGIVNVCKKKRKGHSGNRTHDWNEEYLVC